MKIKWNWGTKLALWIMAFIVFMLGLVTIAVRNSINLVEKDYYPKGLVYQNRIDEMENTKLEHITFLVDQNDQELIISFPNIVVDSGTLFFFRPSDGDLDRTVAFNQADSNEKRLPINQFAKGKYILKAQWNSNNKGYYLEKVIFIK